MRIRQSLASSLHSKTSFADFFRILPEHSACVSGTGLPTCWFERRLRAVRDLVFLVGMDLLHHARQSSGEVGGLSRGAC